VLGGPWLLFGNTTGPAGAPGGEGTGAAGKHGTGCFCCTVKPWSVTLTGCPLTVTWPTTTCASAVAVLLLIALVLIVVGASRLVERRYAQVFG